MFKKIYTVNKYAKEIFMKGVWENKEVYDLFENIEQKKKMGMSLRKAFEEHALKYNRKANSVRNYYYKEIDKLSQDSERLRELKINLNKHKKNQSKNFSEKELSNLIDAIEKEKAKGQSVRKACFKLSNGDPVKMLRFQNKYRNYLKSKSLLDNKNETTSNIIRFSNKKQGLSENDITSLFIGLVRLVKRNLTTEIEEKQSKEKENLNQKLCKAIVEIGEKENELSSLKSKFEKLKKENIMLNQKMMKLKCEKATLLTQKGS